MAGEKLSDPIYTDETEARKYLEGLRWAEGVNCPYCGGVEKIAVLGGKSMGEGWWHCGDCRKKFTVRVGSIFERSHIPLHKWLLAFRLMASSKKGISAHQIHRTLGITYKSAWFMAHRIRECMKDGNPGPMGGYNDPLEVDETFIGSSGYVYHNDGGWKMKRGFGDKMKIVTLVERGGRARSVKVNELSSKSIAEVVLKNADPESILVTDEAPHYNAVGKKFKDHQAVNHSKKQYAEGFVNTNSVEGYFSIFKRGMRGIYQHCGEQHLQRYLHEFDFRYSNRKVTDTERTELAVKGAEGKRLTYRRSHVAKAS